MDGVDDVLWGEDLAHAKVVLYPKRLQDIPGYAKRKKQVVNAGLIIIDPAKKDHIKVVIVKWDKAERAVYLAEEVFRATWKYLKKSVKRGIDIGRENGEEISAERAEEIIDLSCLEREGRAVSLQNGEIVYRAAKLPEARQRALGKKQSMLDDPKNKFFYSKNGDIYHDKDCDMIRKISPEEFCASDAVPENYRACYRCRRKMYLREICSPHVKQMEPVGILLIRQRITDAQLRRYAFEYRLKCRVENTGELTVKDPEDTWIIKGCAGRKLSLWHNNYVRLGEGERLIVSGFHNQGLDGKNMYWLMEYIHGYTFEKHLVSREKDTELEEQCGSIDMNPDQLILSR